MDGLNAFWRERFWCTLVQTLADNGDDVAAILDYAKSAMSVYTGGHGLFESLYLRFVFLIGSGDIKPLFLRTLFTAWSSGRACYVTLNQEPLRAKQPGFFPNEVMQACFLSMVGDRACFDFACHEQLVDGALAFLLTDAGRDCLDNLLVLELFRFVKLCESQPLVGMTRLSDDSVFIPVSTPDANLIVSVATTYSLVTLVASVDWKMSIDIFHITQSKG